LKEREESDVKGKKERPGERWRRRRWIKSGWLW